MRRSYRLLICYRIAAGILLAPTCGLAQDDKSGFTVFDPTPSQQLRPMITDRPVATDGPYTVDAGHVQLEMDGWNRVSDQSQIDGTAVRSNQTSYGAVNARIGVTNDSEIQLMLNPIRAAQTRDVRGAMVDANRGLANVTARLKVNFIGNDDGDVGFAVLPYVTLPTRAAAAGTHAVTGGFSLPVAIKFGDELVLGLMSKVDVGRNEADTAYLPSFINSAVVSYALSRQFGTYAEVLTTKAANGTPVQLTVDTGLTFALTGSMQFDAGVNVGVANARAVNPFVGLSWRF